MNQFNKTILVTGASSYVGAKIYSTLNDKYKVIGTYHNNKLFDDLIPLNLTVKQKVEDVISQYKPDVIIHVANYASNSQILENPNEAQDLNVNATRYIVDSSKKINVKLIFISSFAAYHGSDIYGQNKIKSEEIVKEMKHYVILRPSLIVGLSPNTTNDRPFNRMLNNIIKNTPAKYDSSWKFEVTYLQHLTEIVQEILVNDSIDKVMIPVVADGETSRYKLAKDILSNFNIEVIDENKNSSLPPESIDFSIYDNLHLKKYKYSDVVVDIIKEIKSYLESLNILESD